jgi:hypothetical protein
MTKNATRIGNPAKKAAAKKVSSASDFKKNAKGRDLELPSGLVVRAKRVELQTFILQGSVPNPLMEIVGEALEKGKKADIPKMMGVDEGKLDLAMVNDMYEIVNALVCASVLEPKIHPVPTADMMALYNEEHLDETISDPEELRDDELVYVDEVEDMDKMFIFQWNSGGVEDLATFRREFGADMDALAEIKGG